ncbi:MAG: N-acetyl sugar amidotransferase [Candidatus Magasanikbacteria bacterium]|nr:N-acetyl sugar amidotransferase [Candidatus Magasanikbacteria bacterium]
MINPPKMQYCARCVYPGVAATPLTFDTNGVCTGCRTYDEQESVDWDKRKKLFGDLVQELRSKDGSRYDCVIPVSGGKDSFYQTHIITKEYGLKPLLVTYRENNHTAVGMRNIQRMKEVFDVDYIEFTPSVSVLKKLNLAGFMKMGDPNWHCHCGMFTTPIIVAVKYNIPLIIWGEHGFMNMGGMHSYNDLVEFTAKYRKEHSLRGYDWYDFVGEDTGLSEKDLLWAKYPSDEEIERVGLRGLFISNYFGWKQHEHTKLMVDLYGFEFYDKPFDRTYRNDSNLNDIHDNGVHDYLKYIKFGYGRATDHACRDIRNGILTRDQGIEMVRNYDHVVPGDIGAWLDMVDMPRSEFEKICDRFRDPRVWVKNEYGQWVKDNIWDKRL